MTYYSVLSLEYKLRVYFLDCVLLRFGITLIAPRSDSLLPLRLRAKYFCAWLRTFLVTTKIILLASSCASARIQRSTSNPSHISYNPPQSDHVRPHSIAHLKKIHLPWSHLPITYTTRSLLVVGVPFASESGILMSPTITNQALIG